jgi:two-component system, cell cycle response regulator DivK
LHQDYDGAEHAVRNPNILLVESDDDTRELYAEYLDARGFFVEAFSTADEALHSARPADAVVTALALRGSMDGLQFIARTREREARRTPIVVVTSRDFAAERQRAMSAGADVFLPKPCLPDLLIGELRRVIAAGGA